MKQKMKGNNINIMMMKKKMWKKNKKQNKKKNKNEPLGIKNDGGSVQSGKDTRSKARKRSQSVTADKKNVNIEAKENAPPMEHVNISEHEVQVDL